jgi:TBC domain-containing protein kinase-like protein
MYSLILLDFLSNLSETFLYSIDVVFQELPPELHDFISKCLCVSPHERPTPYQLLQHTLFQDLCEADTNTKNTEEIKYYLFPGFQPRRIPDSQNKKHPLLERNLQELYYLWHLAGGDVQAELRKQGLIRTKAPILSIPK